MKKLFLLFLLCCSILSAKQQKTFGDIKVSKIISVYDGDTFNVNLEQFPPIVGDNIPIRVANIDTPELKDKEPDVKILALQAKIFTKNMLENGYEIILKNIKRGKYFRIVAEVYIDGVCLADELLKHGLAQPYEGGKKPNW